MISQMSCKERWLAAIQLQPVDRLPFWAKVTESYPRAQKAPFCHMDRPALYAWIGSDDHRHILLNCTKEVRKNTSLEVFKDANTHKRVFTTRFGSTEHVEKFDATSGSWHPVKYPVEDVDDIKLMIEFFSDCRVEPDNDALERAKALHEEVGSSALTYTFVCPGERSPIMYWVEILASLDKAHYLLEDYQEEVEELFEAIHRCVLRKTEIMCDCWPGDLLYLGEDTSTTMISPQQFRRYSVRHITEYGQIARDAGRLLLVHMCGKIKALLPDIADLPVAGLEAFTSPPVGDTRLADGRTVLPDKCLSGGTNAVLWTRTAEEIIAAIETDLDALPHHRGVILSPGGAMPPPCKPETIKRVCDWIKSYAVRV